MIRDPKSPPNTNPYHLIVGLGNPGRRYTANRHNVGFMVIERLARRYELVFARKKGKARLTEGIVLERRVLLAQPQTYMNLSGTSVAALTRFFHIPHTHLMVIYDDLDLPIARLRLRPGGGAGGHKGLQSTIDHLGTADFPRLRIGIGRPQHGEPSDFVLHNFSQDEWLEMDSALDRAVEAIEHWLLHGIDAAMNTFNS
ncbi:MAG: aminoacyl-tRNA hydrolase [Chloroflexota bacterium]